MNRIQQAHFDRTDGIVVSPAAYTHTSAAILDSLKAAGIPAAAHLTGINARENLRRLSYA